MIQNINLFDIILGSIILLLVGLAIGLLIKRYDETKEKNLWEKIIEYIWIFAGTYLIFLLFNLFSQVCFLKIEEKYYPLLGAVGIILSAFIASMSVFVSIENTKRIEKTKNQKVKNKVELYFNTILSTTKAASNELRSYKIEEINTLIEYYERTYVKIEEDKEIISYCSAEDTLVLFARITKMIESLQYYKENKNKNNYFLSARERNKELLNCMLRIFKSYNFKEITTKAKP